ncbi:MAG: hypothetical protein CL677_08340 [Bdellovibrionaceae bacterium]|nr:hypothetical protein [Pseudobdellovibrionaceae bacterium]|tara:strand:- start:117081 stop:117302 length:222 start_codon:yes stop_codon:yes gene_type:complete
MNRGMYIFIGVGIELAFLVIGALYLGETIDKEYELRGLGQAGLLLVVFVGWVIHFIVLLKRFQDQLKDQSESE